MPLNRRTLFLYLDNFLGLPKLAIAAGWGNIYNNKLQGVGKTEGELKELNMIVWSNEDCNNTLKRKYMDQVKYQTEKGTEFLEYKIRSITSFVLCLFHE